MEIRDKERLRELRKMFRSELKEQTDRLVVSDEASAATLARELQYASGRISDEIRQGSEDVVLAIQQMSDYLGEGLSEVRWAVEQQTRVSQDILRVLLSSLDNQSRQYWDQGVQCFLAAELDMAKERFERALDANRTNHFAYQFLGHIALDRNNLQDAIRNFELAHKFATTGYHKAFALSCLSECHAKREELDSAVEAIKRALDAYWEWPKLHCDLARYSARLGRAQEACSALRHAIDRDWTYWEVAICDKSFNSIRADVIKLLERLREYERENARDALNTLKQALEVARKVGAGVNPPVVHETLSARLSEENVHVYRNVAEQAWKTSRDVYSVAERTATARIHALEKSLMELRNRAPSTYDKYELKFGTGCALWFSLYLIIAVVLAVIIGLPKHAPTGQGLSSVPSLIWWCTILATALTFLLPWLENKRRYTFHVELPRRRYEAQAKSRTVEVEPEMTRLRKELENINLGLKAVPGGANVR